MHTLINLVLVLGDGVLGYLIYRIFCDSTKPTIPFGPDNNLVHPFTVDDTLRPPIPKPPPPSCKTPCPFITVPIALQEVDKSYLDHSTPYSQTSQGWTFIPHYILGGGFRGGDNKYIINNWKVGIPADGGLCYGTTGPGWITMDGVGCQDPMTNEKHVIYSK